LKGDARALRAERQISDDIESERTAPAGMHFPLYFSMNGSKMVPLRRSIFILQFQLLLCYCLHLFVLVILLALGAWPQQCSIDGGACMRAAWIGVERVIAIACEQYAIMLCIYDENERQKGASANGFK
jgi:hypothetical protein